MHIVLDYTSTYRDKSLNDEVYQGPYLMSSLASILLQFREQPIAFCANTETMFYQVKVPQEQRSLLRYLWYKNGDLSIRPVTYQMTVHPFGCVWSPSCATFILQKTAKDQKEEFDSEIIEAVRRAFYVDDYLMSSQSEKDAINLARMLQNIILAGHFKLTKFASNSIEVLASIPEEKRVNEVNGIDLGSVTLPNERH